MPRLVLEIMDPPMDLQQPGAGHRPASICRQRLGWGTRPINSVAWSPDGLMLALGCADETVRLHAARTGELVRDLSGQGGPVNSVAWSPDGRVLASGSADGAIRLWDAATGAVQRILP